MTGGLLISILFHKEEVGKLADRKKDVCVHIIPVYYGDRGVGTRGKPFTSKDYYYECYVSEDKNKSTHRQANNIEELCEGCKKYLYIKHLKEETK